MIKAKQYLQLFAIIGLFFGMALNSFSLPNLTQPTVQAKYIGITGKTANSISIKWNKGSGGVGNYSRTLILISSSDNYYGMSFTPTDSNGNGGNQVSYASINSNTNASANSNIFINYGWIAVYYGSENTVNITDLKPNQKYWIVAVAANDNNGDGIGAVFANTWELYPQNYFSNPRQITTLAPTSLSGPSNIYTAMRNPNSISLNWTFDPTSVDGYIVDFANDPNYTNYSGMTYYHNFDIGNTNQWEFDGLAPGSKYYTRMKSYAGNVQSNYVMPGTDGKVYTLAAEPIASPMFTQSYYGATGDVIFNWSGGATLSPNKRYLLTLGYNSYNYYDAWDGTDYSFSTNGPNNVYPKGQSIGTHNVVYDGDATTVTVSGLTNGQQYSAKLYVYDTGLNGPDDKNYRTNDAQELNFTNVSAEPTLQAGNLVYTPLMPEANKLGGLGLIALGGNQTTSPNQFGMSWNAATVSDPKTQIGYIIVAYQGNNPSIKRPVDGFGYFPVFSYLNDPTTMSPYLDFANNLNFGPGSNCKVVYDGNQTNFVLNSLAPATQYTFVVYAYGWNGYDPNTRNYLTTITTNSLTRYSIADQPMPVKNVVASKSIEGSAKSVTLNWASDGADKYLVAVKAAPTDAGVATLSGLTNGFAPNWNGTANSVYGTTTFIHNGETYSYIYKGSNTSVNITGLNTSTTYNFYVVPLKANPINDESNNYGNAMFVPDMILAPKNGEFTTRNTNSVVLSYDAGKGYTKLLAVYNKNNNTFDGPNNGTSYPGSNQLLNSSNTNGGNASFSLDMKELYNMGKLGFDPINKKEYVVIDNLQLDQVYQVRLYGYNGGNGTEIYTADQGNYASYQHTTLAEQPIMQASSIIASAITDNSVELNWTNGSGTKSVVFAGTSLASINQFPQDGSSLIANGDFTSPLSNNIAGAKVVYQGTGSSAVITGLPSNTEMFFAVYTFSGNTANFNNTGKGSENYNETLFDLNVFKSNRISAKTLAPKPAIATNLNFKLAERGESQMRIAWTDNTLGQAKYLILANTSNVFGLPADGVSYSSGNTSYTLAASFIGGGKIVYNGNNITNILVENLPTSIDGTPIYYRVYSYLGNPGSERYSNQVSAEMITLSNDPNTTIPTSISATKGNNGQVSFNWTNGNVNDKNILFYRAGGTPTGPVNGVYNLDGSNIDANTKVLVNDLATGTTLRTISGNFTPGVSYTLKLAAYKGIRYPNGDSYISLNDGNYTVGSNRFNSIFFPTSVTFVPLTAEPTTTSAVTISNPTSTSLDVSWTAANGANRYIVVVKQGSTATVAPTDGTSWINNSANKYTQNYTYDFGTYASTYFTGTFEAASVVYNGTATNTTITGLSSDATYYITVYPFNQTGVGLESENYGTGTTVNRSTLVGKPSSASGLNISNVTSSTALLTYAHSAENVMILGVKAATQTDLPAGGTTYNVNDVIGNSKVYYTGSASSANISALSANSQYTFRVFAFNGSGGKENYASGSNASSTTTALSSPASKVKITSVPSGNVLAETSYDYSVQLVDEFNMPSKADHTGTLTVKINGTTMGTLAFNTTSTDYTISASYPLKDGINNNTLTVSGTGLTDATQSGFTIKASEPVYAPTALSSSNLKSPNRIALTWTAGADNTGYLVYAVKGNYYPASTCTDFTTISAATWDNTAAQRLVYVGTNTNYTLTPVTAYTTYKFRIVPYKGDVSNSTVNYAADSYSALNSKYFFKKNVGEGENLGLVGEGFEATEISPNPVKDNVSFYIENYSENPFTIEISNTAGEKIATGYDNVILSKGQNNINIPFGNNVAAGSYFLTIRSGNDIVTTSFVYLP